MCCLVNVWGNVYQPKVSQCVVNRHLGCTYDVGAPLHIYRVSGGRDGGCGAGYLGRLSRIRISFMAVSTRVVSISGKGIAWISFGLISHDARNSLPIRSATSFSSAQTWRRCAQSRHHCGSLSFFESLAIPQRRASGYRRHCSKLTSVPLFLVSQSFIFETRDMGPRSRGTVRYPVRAWAEGDSAFSDISRAVSPHSVPAPASGV